MAFQWRPPQDRHQPHQNARAAQGVQSKLAKRATTGAAITFQHGWPTTANVSCARPPSRSPSAARARRTRLDRQQVGTTQPSLGSARFQSAALDWEGDRWRVGFGHRGNAAGWKLTSHDEALVLGAAYAIRWHSGSHGTEAFGSPLRNTPARDQQVGTAHRMEPATGLAAASTLQSAA